MSDDLLRRGMAALRSGDRATAQTLLTRVTEVDPRNEQAWLWLSGAVSTPTEQRRCLEQVLSINPQNDAAKRGLEKLGSAPAIVAPAPPLAPTLVPTETVAPSEAVPLPNPSKAEGHWAKPIGVIILIVLVCGSLPFLIGMRNRRAGCDVQGYSTTMQPIATEWDDAVTLAGSMPRMSLGSAVANLQEIRRKTDEITVPSCLEDAHEYFVEAQDAQIRGYLAFLGQKDDVVVTASFNEAEMYMDRWMNALTVANGKPLPTSTTASLPPQLTPTRTRPTVVVLPTNTQPSVVITPDRGPVGMTITVTGKRWLPGQTLDIEVSSASTGEFLFKSAVGPVAPDGTFTTTLTLDRKPDQTPFPTGTFDVKVSSPDGSDQDFARVHVLP